MTTHANRKMISLPAGVTVKPLYEKCPKCGFDLEKFDEGVADKRQSDRLENKSERTWTPSSVNKDVMRKTPLLRLYGFMHWVVNPLTSPPDYATKTDHKGFFDRVFGKKARTIKKNGERTDDNDHLVPGIKRKF